MYVFRGPRSGFMQSPWEAGYIIRTVFSHRTVTATPAPRKNTAVRQYVRITTNQNFEYKVNLLHLKGYAK